MEYSIYMFKNSANSPHLLVQGGLSLHTARRYCAMLNDVCVCFRTEFYIK